LLGQLLALLRERAAGCLVRGFGGGQALVPAGQLAIAGFELRQPSLQLVALGLQLGLATRVLRFATGQLLGASGEVGLLTVELLARGGQLGLVALAGFVELPALGFQFLTDGRRLVGEVGLLAVVLLAGGRDFAFSAGEPGLALGELPALVVELHPATLELVALHLHFGLKLGAVSFAAGQLVEAGLHFGLLAGELRAGGFALGLGVLELRLAIGLLAGDLVELADAGLELAGLMLELAPAAIEILAGRVELRLGPDQRGLAAGELVGPGA
jgi:hypothetical protein